MSDIFTQSLRWHHSDTQTDIWIYEIAPIYQHALTTWPPKQIAAISQQYRSERRQREKIALHTLLAHLLPYGSELTYTTNGRPYLQNSALHISISHHETLIAIACSTTPIGVDIEQESTQITRVASKFFTPEEQVWAQENGLALAMLWSAKEAVYKWANKKGLSPLNDIGLSGYQPDHTLQAYVKPYATTYTIQTRHLGKGDYLAWCTATLP